MDTRLTTEGRSAVKVMAKVIGITAAISVGMGELAVAGRSLAAWWNQAAVSAPVRQVAMPSYVSAPMPAPPPATIFHFQGIPAQQSYPVQTYAPGYSPPGPVWPGPVRMMSSGYRPGQNSQQRYFTYPTNFQSGFHPNSGPAAGRKK
jgi:hypothetical protein